MDYLYEAILKKPQKCGRHSHLRLGEFLRVREEISQKFLGTLISKTLKVFLNCYPQPRRFSIFENETKNSHGMSFCFATLIDTMF